MSIEPLGASFRDPSGFVYRRDGDIFRQVERGYSANYDRLMESGLYEALVERGWLIPHEEVDRHSREAYRTLKPEMVPFISYPYEWCFGQLKDAALLTLDVQLLSLSFGMSLKDASSYNVQFVGCRPVLIDTLSFEEYREGRPWVAYRQFCQHFLAPLALIAYVDPRLRQLSRHFIDGVPLDFVSGMLPWRARVRPGLLAHLHLHALSQRRHRADAAAPGRAKRIPSLPRARLEALLESLRGTVRRCRISLGQSEWGSYYSATNYAPEALAAKEAVVERMVEEHAEPEALIHDLGANDGRFSRLLAGRGRYVVSHDVDDVAVERNYREGRARGVEDVLPLFLDLTNPSPALGWALRERASTLERTADGTVLALALVHHLAISNNVPLNRIAELFASMAKTLIIEFVPKEDSQVRRLLATREDIFEGYYQGEFEKAFSAWFDIREKELLPATARTLFAMRRKG